MAPDRLPQLLESHRFAQPVYVTRPSLPALDAFQARLEPVWRKAWLTNDGDLQQELEARLVDRLGIEHLSLCCNGTVALLIALQAAGIDHGEVVTTPFTFPATTHALHWNRVTPVFCDIDTATFNLDPERLEALIGPDTRAILPVHVFGRPCEVDAIQSIADRHGLPVLYDAAHAMGVRLRGRSILCWGALSVLSFHATKLFTTAEGGAIVAHEEPDYERIRFLRNFGIADADTVIGPGINGKLSELHAAFGLLQLDQLDDEITRRLQLTRIYREALDEVPGIDLLDDADDVEPNGAYLPVLVEPGRYGLTRDELHDALTDFNVFPRKYFHPLCSRIPTYAGLASAAPERLPSAEWVAARILCLPLFGSLPESSVRRICEILRHLGESHR